MFVRRNVCVGRGECRNERRRWRGWWEEGEAVLHVHEIEPERQNKGGLLFILKLEQLGPFSPRGAPWIDYWTSIAERESKHPPFHHCHRPFLTSIPVPSPPLLLQRSDRSGPDMGRVLHPDDPTWFCWASFFNNTNSILWFSCRWRQNKWA